LALRKIGRSNLNRLSGNNEDGFWPTLPCIFRLLKLALSIII
jgi:hypothetical protein